MKTHRLFIIVLLLGAMGLSKAFAFDFWAVCPSGDTLYYEITNPQELEVAVVRPGSYSWYGYTKPSGDLVLPESITNSGDGFIYSVTSIGTDAFNSCMSLTSIFIPNSITNIGDGSFSWCNGLASVTIPNSVISIGGAAFASCSGLTSVTIPNSVTLIGHDAFSYCTSLTSVELPNTLNFIGSYAFVGCIGLTSIAIPQSVTTIENGVFSSCDNLANIIVESGNTVFDSRNNCNAIIETNTNCLVVGCKNTIIPNSVTSIGNSAFSGCSGLTSITIPNSVTSIGNSAFQGCSGLTSITIPNSITSIGDYAFYGCSGLASIIIPNSVTSIGGFSFYGCNGISSITIPDSVISIGPRAFQECSNLESITIGNSVASIGVGCFANCKCLKSITIPKSVTSIREELFASCVNLEEIIVEGGNSVYDSREGCNAIIETCTNKLIAGCKSSFIPNSVTSIGSEAFYNCRGLSSIVIPNYVASIEGWAFLGTSMTYVVALGDNPPQLGNKAFGIHSNNKLIVSCGDKEAYENSNWVNYFEDIEEGCGNYDIYKAVNDSNGAGGSFVGLPSCSKMGDVVCFSLTPNPGCHVASVIVQKSDNPFQTIPITEDNNGENSYCFVMPPFAVSVRATFAIGNSTDENLAIPVSIYPNPTSGKIKMESEDIKHVCISNMLGQLVYEGKAEGDNFEYDFSDYGAGVYLIRITTSVGVETKRIVVTR